MEINIDIGNTRNKWKITTPESRTSYGVSQISLSVLAKEIRKSVGVTGKSFLSPEKIRVACVRSHQARLELNEGLQAEFGMEAEFAVTQQNSCGIINSYSNPEAMGVDRWCAILAAAAETKNYDGKRSFCVIDAGTALTLDFVDENGAHLGGYITPGYQMQLDSLSKGTGKIDIDSLIVKSNLFPGKNTDEAVRAGILSSMMSHIECAVKRFKNNTVTEVMVYITGGDAIWIQEKSDLKYYHRPHLVLDGLDVLMP